MAQAKTAEYSGTINQPACYVILRDSNGNVLFLLRENTGYMDGKFSLPAGRVEPLETFQAGAAREALEEVGVTVLPRDLRHVFTLHRLADHKEFVCVDVFFEAKTWQGTPVNAEPHKHGALRWLSVADMKEKAMDYQSYALQRIAAGDSYGEFGW